MSNLSGTELLRREQRLVLPRDQHVADSALDERRRRAARARVQHRHVVVELPDEVARRCFVPLVLAQRVAPRGEVVPPRATGRLRVRRDHLHVGADQVVPVLDPLRVPLPDDERDRRRERRAVVRQLLLPVRRQRLAALRDLVDVVREAERHHVRLEPVDHRTRLRSRPAVRLLDLHLLPRAPLPLPRERGVDVLVQLARRIVRHVEQRHLLLRGGRPADRRNERERECQPSDGLQLRH